MACMVRRRMAVSHPLVTRALHMHAVAVAVLGVVLAIVGQVAAQSSMVAPAGLVATDELDFSVVFGEPTTGLTAADFHVAVDDRLSTTRALLGSGTTFTLRVTAQLLAPCPGGYEADATGAYCGNALAVAQDWAAQQLACAPLLLAAIHDDAHNAFITSLVPAGEQVAWYVLLCGCWACAAPCGFGGLRAVDTPGAHARVPQSAAQHPPWPARCRLTVVLTCRCGGAQDRGPLRARRVPAACLGQRRSRAVHELGTGARQRRHSRLCWHPSRYARVSQAPRVWSWFTRCTPCLCAPTCALADGTWVLAACSETHVAVCAAWANRARVTASLPANAGNAIPATPALGPVTAVYAPPIAVIRPVAWHEGQVAVDTLQLSVNFSAPVTGVTGGAFMVDAGPAAFVGATTTGSGRLYTLSVEVAPPSEIPCPAGFTASPMAWAVVAPATPRFCARVLPTTSTWTTAQAACAPYQLATITSVAHNELVRVLVRDAGLPAAWYVGRGGGGAALCAQPLWAIAVPPSPSP